MKRMYYAEYCRWGVNMSYESMNGSAFTFYAFDSKAKRDEWVEAHEWNGYSNRTTGESTRKAVEHCCGKNFSLVKADEGVWVCCRKGMEGAVEMELISQDR